MSGLQKLVRIRFLQEQLIQRELVAASNHLARTRVIIEVIQKQRAALARARTVAIIAGAMEDLADVEASIGLLATYQVDLAVKAKSQLVLLQSHQERCQLAHAEKLKPETLHLAELKSRSTQLQKEMQKKVDDYYLSKRMHSKYASHALSRKRV
jgi:hypothetical protein